MSDVVLSDSLSEKKKVAGSPSFSLLMVTVAVKAMTTMIMKMVTGVR